MAQFTVSTLPRIKAPALRDLLLEPSKASSIAVIDVRDDDYIGGHIKGSLHVPPNTHDYRMPDLVRTLAVKDVVVFHCMLSQQRGPTAAMRYARERSRMFGEKEGRCWHEGDPEGKAMQKVMVLERGFGGWQQLYGEDEQVTEAYNKDLWEDGFG